MKLPRETRIMNALNMSGDITQAPVRIYNANEVIIVFNLWVSEKQDFRGWFCGGWYTL